MNSAPKHFRTAAAFRTWLERHHGTATELTLLFYNKPSGRGGITYQEALDEALCFGWIDGIVHTMDAISHTRRFTPRRTGSIWSRINVAHVARLSRAGRMAAAGMAAFAARRVEKTGIYSFEQRPQDLPPELAAIFQRHAAAWTFWSAQPPGYRRTLTWWVVSAKQPATRRRRLDRLIQASAEGRRVV